jgi:S-methylmethionine-dependent homocysteine/selenocysteine methylase
VSHESNLDHPLLLLESKVCSWHRPSRWWAPRGFPLIATSVGPYGAYLANGAEYRGNYGLSVEDLIEFHAERVRLLVCQAHTELIAFETVPEDLEARAILQIMTQFPGTAQIFPTATAADVLTTLSQQTPPSGYHSNAEMKRIWPTDASFATF